MKLKLLLTSIILVLGLFLAEVAAQEPEREKAVEARNQNERAIENRNRATERRAAAKARNEARRQNEGMRESVRERQQARPQTPAGDGQGQPAGSQRRGH